MKRILIILFFSILTFNWVQSQVELKNDAQVTGFKNIPQERVYTHVNTSLFLTGEYLYYSLYCINTENNLLSPLSKIGYVELISENGEQLFKQKIKLENGLGQGDFFIPVTAETGSYKLLAYTNWMKNEPINHFFQTDIHIINPYQVPQVNYNANKTINTLGTSNNKNKEKVNINSNIGPLELDLSSQTFNTRSKVSLTLNKKNEAALPLGNYSISVRKKSKIYQPSKQTFTKFLHKTNSENSRSNTQTVYLPELRGELFSGRVSSNSNKTLKDLKVAVSIPGENFYIDIAKTDSDGKFYININKNYEGDRVFLEILDDSKEGYIINLNEQTSLDYSNLVFENLVLDSLMKDEIIQRSIHNQIDNAYFKFKPDSIVSGVSEQLLDGKKIQSYKLDDFTRFRSVRETIFEIVKDVSISKIDKSNSVLRIQGYNYGTNSGVLPLVIIDGLQITNITKLLERNAFTIDEIKVLRDRFVLGSKVYQGAILFKTNNNTIDEFQNEVSVFSFYILKPQEKKQYFKQRYNINSSSSIPDDRLQLLWIPNLNLSENKTTVEFYTSDVTGEFEICIEGYTNQKEPVSIKHYFSVKSD